MPNTQPTNGADAAYQLVRTPLAFLVRSARRLPEKTAVIDEYGSCTYADLLERSRRVGSALAGGPEPFPMIVFMEKSTQMLIAFLGTLMAGGFYVPVDPSVPVERAQQIARTLAGANLATQDAEAAPLALPRVIVNEQTRAAAAEAFPGADLLAIEELQLHPIDDAALDRCARALVDTNPAYVLFTSGSTGVPKGVAVSHRAIRGFIDGFVATLGIREDDVLGNQAPFDFDVSVKDIYSALATGATVALLPRRLFSAPAQLVDAIREHQATVLIWAAAALCLVSSLHALDHAALPQVRLVMFSGEVMPRKHLARWLEHLPHASFVNLYGPTEITCNCLYHPVDRSRSYEQGMPLGSPFPNRRILVLDDGQRPVTEPGAEGELYVGGPDIALGYYGSPDRTAAAFIPDPLCPAIPRTVYRTGDLVRIDEAGELIFCGRADNQIKHQGHRIELEEIDAAFEAQPGVERCRCAYDTRLKRIYAFFEGTADAEELRATVARRLPLPMMPARIEPIDQMPLTKNGKVDRAALLERARSQVHVPAHRAASAAPPAPAR